MHTHVRRWNRRTSEELGAEFSKDLQTIAGYLTRAKQSNDKVMGELNEGSKGMLALMEDRQSLETSHPHLNTQHDPQASAGDGAEVKTRMEVGGDKDTNHDNNHNNTNDREKPRKSTTPLAPEAQKLAALLDGLSKHLMTRQTLLQNYTDKAGSMQSNIQSHLLKELNKKDPGYIVEQVSE